MNTLLKLLLHSLWISLVFGQHVEKKWKFLDFDWLSEKHKNDSINSGQYNASSVVPIDVQFAGATCFLAIPRGSGVPAALATVVPSKNGGDPVLRPYPDWSWTGTNCKHSIISTYRLALDKCGRLWVLDNGKNGETQVCPPKILAFDLKTNKLLLLKEIPNEYAFNKKTGKGLLVTPIVDTCGKNCEELTMYIADIEGYGLIVWNGKDKFKRFDSEVFTAPMSNFTLNNVSFHLEDGLVGLALYKDKFNKKYLYFNSLASVKLYHVLTKELSVDSNKTPHYVEDKGDIDFRKVPLVIEGNIMYFCSLEGNSLMSWDVRTKFTKKNVKLLWKDDKVLQFVSGLKAAKGGGVYGISNRYQETAAGVRNINDYTIHIFSYHN